MPSPTDARIERLHAVLREIRARLAVPVAGATVPMLERRDRGIVEEIDRVLDDPIRIVGGRP
jgi:hypothetical protein